METKSADAHILAQTYELGQARLRLRSDLKFTLHSDGHSRWYLVEDESSSEFFRIGITQYAFLSLLNGRRTLDEAIAKLASLGCCDDLDLQEAAALSRWVIESGLAESAAAKSVHRISNKRSRVATQKIAQWLNPIAFRVSLFNPDRLLSLVYGKLRWLAGWPVVMIWIVVTCIGLFSLVNVWEEFWNLQIRSISAFDFLWIGLSWLILKVFHEGAHGLLCKHFGGKVKEVGVLWLLLIPLPYVDVSSSWRFTKRSKRILTAAAGILAEVLIASVAIYWWAKVDPGPLRFHLGNLFIAATVNTLLFNMNPLMKFDGYYILSDALGIPNLYTRGLGYVKQFFKWAFFGVKFQEELEPVRWKTRLIRAYGFAAIIWFALICVALGTAAISLFHGFGLIVGLAAIVVWLGIPLIRLLKYLLMRQEIEQPSRIRFCSVLAGLFFLIYLSAVNLPAPDSISAPLVILEDQSTVIRNQTAGFVETIHVRQGDQVDRGDPLFTLYNPQLLASMERLECEIEATQLRASIYRNDQDVGTWQIEKETLQSLLEQKQELKSQFAALSIVATNSGIVVANELEQLDGVYVEMGEELARVVKDDSKRAIAMVSQQDALWLRAGAGNKDAFVYLFGRDGPSIQGKIDTISPRALDQLPHFALSTENGGTISVVSRPQVDSELSEGASRLQRKSFQTQVDRKKSLFRFASQSSAEMQMDKKLVRPYVSVSVELSSEATSNLSEGQTGYLLIGGRDERLGKYLYRNIKSWIASQIRLTHGL